MPNQFLKRLKENSEYFEFWEDFNEFCENFKVPDLEEFVETLPILYKRIENDGASYHIYEALSKYAKEYPKEAINIFKLIEERNTKYTLEFSASILSGLSRGKTNYPYKVKILEFINSSDENKIYSGIDAAYRMSFVNKKEELKFINEVHISLKKVIKNKPKNCLGIITRFYNKHLITIKEAKSIVLELLELKDTNVQMEVARSLNEEFKFDDDNEHFKSCLNLLSHTNTDYKNIYKTIKYRLKNEIISNPDVIIEFINTWVINNERNSKKISVLKELIEELYFKHSKIIQNLFLDWLNSDKKLYKNALHFLISDLSSSVDKVGLNKESLKKLSEIDSLYITFMIAGYVFDHNYATEMLYNILEVKYKNERVRNHIASIFARHLIINYYSITDTLKEKRKSANKTIKSIINQILEVSENYYQRISDLELVNEFEPSDKRMQYFNKQQNIKMQELIDASEKKENSFLNMFTNVNLRAGRFFFSKYKGEYSQESEMQNYKSSFEVARFQYIDEIGQEKMRLMWQNMKKDELPN